MVAGVVPRRMGPSNTCAPLGSDVTVRETSLLSDGAGAAATGFAGAAAGAGFLWPVSFIPATSSSTSDSGGGGGASTGGGGGGGAELPPEKAATATTTSNPPAPAAIAHVGIPEASFGF